jgi:hypothetical protein
VRFLVGAAVASESADEKLTSRPGVPSHDRRHFKQTPQVCIDMNRDLGPYLQPYLCWEMEREHGDLGLRSNHPDKPLRLSKLGKRFRSSGNKDLVQETLNLVNSKAGNIIAIARLRMEIIHTGDDAPEIGEGLPRKVVSLFNAVIDSCSEFGVKAIAAASHLVQQTSEKHVRVESLERVLKPEPGSECTTVRLLRSAKGVLVALEVKDSPPPSPLLVMFYNDDFGMYAAQGYNERLQKALSGMRSALDMEKKRMKS